MCRNGLDDLVIFLKSLFDHAEVVAWGRGCQSNKDRQSIACGDSALVASPERQLKACYVYAGDEVDWRYRPIRANSQPVFTILGGLTHDHKP